MDGMGPSREETFNTSWNRIEEFYHEDVLVNPTWNWLIPLTELISDLRTRGYDKHLRAGQSVYHFILSRSKRHGLRADQAMIRMVPEVKGMIVYYHGSDGDEEIAFDRVEFNQELEQILFRLIQHEID